MSKALENLLDEAREVLDIHLGVSATSGNFDLCESPIEQAFLAAYDMHALLWRGASHVGLPDAAMTERCKSSGLLEVFIKPQWQVAGYRADFLMGYAGAGSHKQTSIIVECDGHQWHERTKEQAQRDKERDRVLNEHVAKVIRFTGSEIHSRPMACYQQAMDVLDASLFAWLHK